MTETTPDLAIMSMDALLDETSEINSMLATAMDSIKARLREAKRFGEPPTQRLLLIIDNCEALWMRPDLDAKTVGAIVRFGQAANVGVTLRAAQPHWIPTARGGSDMLGLSTIGDAVLRDMIMENMNSETAPAWPSITFEVMP